MPELPRPGEPSVGEPQPEEPPDTVAAAPIAGIPATSGLPGAPITEAPAGGTGGLY